MRRIDRNNVFEHPRFYNELVALNCFAGGLTLGELLVVLCGTRVKRNDKEKIFKDYCPTIRSSYMSFDTILRIGKNLHQRRRIRSIRMIDADGNLTLERENAVVPRDEVRLSKDLHKLFEMGVIMKTKDKRYQIFAGTEDIMSTAIHQRVLRNFVNVEKARAVAIQQGKITASDLLNAHITMGNTTVYSNIFMSKKSSRCNYETEVQRIAEKFNQVMDELYSLIRQHSIKDFNIHHPPVTVVIDEPWRRNPEEEKAVFSKDMEEIKKLRPEYAKQMQRMLNLKEKKSSNRPYNSKQNW